MDKYKNIKRSFRESGVLVLRIDLALPELLGDAGKFYERLAARYLEFADKELFGAARQKFILSDDEKKRFSFAPYLFRVYSQCKEDGGILAVSRREELSRKGRIILEIKRTDLFDTESGFFIKPRRKTKKAPRKKR